MVFMASLIEVPVFKFDFGHDNHQNIASNNTDQPPQVCPPCVCHCPILETGDGEGSSSGNASAKKIEDEKIREDFISMHYNDALQR